MHIQALGAQDIEDHMIVRLDARKQKPADRLYFLCARADSKDGDESGMVRAEVDRSQAGISPRDQTANGFRSEHVLHRRPWARSESCP